MNLQRRVWAVFCALLLGTALLTTACGSGDGTCTKNGDCTKAGEKCISGTCKKPDTTPEDKCKDVKCDTGKTCNKDTGKCEGGTTTPDKCKDVKCDTGKTCNKETGKCEGTTTNPDKCKDVKCKPGEACDPADGQCKDNSKCAGVSCQPGETCNPTTGKCEAKQADDCTQTGCPAGKKCNTTTKKCEDAPSGCTSDDQCPQGQKCDTSTGQCKAEPNGNAGLGETCNDTTLCKQGLLCVQLDSNSTDGKCYTECTNDATLCGSDSCIALNNGKSLCLKEAAKDEACGTDKGIICKRNQDPPLYCSASSGKCAEIVIQKNEGDPCSKEGSNDDPPKICDIKSNLICDQTTGQCKKAKLAALHGQCGANDTICDGSKDQTCLRMSENAQHGYCFAKCANANDTNCSGRCTELNDGSFLCIPEGSKDLKDKCGEGGDPNAASYDTSSSCKKNQICLLQSQGAKHGYCLALCSGAKDANCDGECVELTNGSHACRPAGSKDTGEKCGGQSDPNAAKLDTSTSCKKGHICLLTSQGATEGNCFLTCANKTDQACTGANGDQGSCNELSNGGFYCSKFGSKKEDELCGQDSSATKIDDTKNCAKGLICLRLSSTNPKGLCSKLDENGCSTMQCGQGKNCVSLNSGAGACVKDCSSDPKVCTEPGTVCETVGSLGPVCSPEPIYGPNDYGALCKPNGDPAKDGCKKGFFCLPTDQQQTTGFCSADCTQTNTCNNVTNSSGQTVAGSCEALSSSSACLFKCDSAQNTPCPDGMTCKAVQGGQEFCLP